MNRKIIAIIPASGIGSRMNAALPKQYLTLQGKTILEHTVAIFLNHPQIDKIVIALSANDQHHQHISLLTSDKIQLVNGGASRAESVFNALQSIDEHSWALVHDAARPCLKRSDLDKLLQITDQNGAILASPVVDTLKRAEGNKISHTEDRTTLWHALTPQFFPTALLKQALQQAFDRQQNVTDEASAMELAGYQPTLITGSNSNLKIPRPEDLALAEFYLMHSLEK